jgi:hypothetical protein
MTAPREKNADSLPLLILSIAALFVPRALRAQWLQDWKSELWYVQRGSCRVRHRPQSDRAALLFSLGAFKDALWLRREGVAVFFREKLWLQSPSRCLVFLAALAFGAASRFVRNPGLFETVVRPPGFFGVDVLMVVLSALIVPATISVAPSEYSPASRSRLRRARLRRWGFLLAKTALLLPTLSCLLFYSSLIPGAAFLEAYLIVPVHVLAFRWVLTDQRRRCPVCLRLLAKPARVAQPFPIFGEWYGIRYFCPKGHGSLYVPEIYANHASSRWSDPPTPDAHLT